MLADILLIAGTIKGVVSAVRHVAKHGRIVTSFDDGPVPTFCDSRRGRIHSWAEHGSCVWVTRVEGRNPGRTKKLREIYLIMPKTGQVLATAWIRHTYLRKIRPKKLLQAAGKLWRKK